MLRVSNRPLCALLTSNRYPKRYCNPQHWISDKSWTSGAFTHRILFTIRSCGHNCRRPRPLGCPGFVDGMTHTFAFWSSDNPNYLMNINNAINQLFHLLKLRYRYSINIWSITIINIYPWNAKNLVVSSTSIGKSLQSFIFMESI